jgi:hypothetical protein
MCTGSCVTRRHILREYGERHRNTSDVAIELPTGLGKTLVAFLVADEALDRGRSVAYLIGTSATGWSQPEQVAPSPGSG